jgi:hypothetical protein
MTGKRNAGHTAHQTPLRKAMKANSNLLPLVFDGIQALDRNHRRFIHSELRGEFADSLEIDENLRVGHEQENRWDYLLGKLSDGAIIGFEPHSAKTDQVSKVIKKRQMALQQLEQHFKADVLIKQWFWVASGTVHFANTDKERRVLDQNGIEFVGTKLMKKHLRTL